VKSWLKGFAVVMAVAALSVVMFQKESQALVSNKPTAQNGPFKTWVYEFGTTTSSAHSAAAVTTPDGASTYILNIPSSTIGIGTVLYGFSVKAETAGGTAAVWDSASVHTISTSNYTTKIVDELGEATQYDTAYTDWPAPRKLENGISITTVRAPVVTVFYE